jgi:II/X family phage/plasmid replication protein
MIDTIGVYITLTPDVKAYLDNSFATLTQRIDRGSGEIIFEYSNLQYTLSHNYRVTCRLDDRIWSYDPRTEKTSLVSAPEYPYLRLEFSAPKVLYGHNLLSCSLSDACYAANLVREHFNAEFGVDLPPVKDWYLYRLDTCANYVLDNLSQVKSYISYLQRFNYPRRIKNQYEDTGLYFAGRTLTLKIYAKGVEFRKHDAKRFLDEVERARLQKAADRILRIEVEHKNIIKTYIANYEKTSKNILQKLQGYTKIYDTIGIIDFKEIMDKTVLKVLSGTETKIMKSLDVHRVLHENLGARQANTYYAIWTLIVTQGQKVAKERTTRSLYYEALRTFRRLNISLIASDLQKIDIALDRGFPEDFSLKMSPDNPYYQLPTDITKYNPARIDELLMPRKAGKVA